MADCCLEAGIDTVASEAVLEGELLVGSQRRFQVAAFKQGVGSKLGHLPTQGRSPACLDHAGGLFCCFTVVLQG